ncbi:MAG: hypothetical protein ACYC1Q_08215 [Bacteroidia bacterium]
MISFRSVGQEQISTWPFAEKIGWRGVQLQFGFLQPFEGQRYSNDLFIRLAKSSEKARIKGELAGAYDNAFATTNLVSIRLSAIFLPFRERENLWLKKSEWQSGFEFTGAYAMVSLDDSISSSWHYYNALNNSLYWYNNWQFEHRLLFNNVKIYAGPGLALTIAPSYQFYSDAYTSYSYSGKQAINHGKFGFNFNVTAGIKVSLGCRTNLYVEYQFYNQNWVMEGDFLSQSMDGFGLGLRYKFNKPDRSKETPKTPVFW